MGKHRHPLHLALPFTAQDCARLEVPGTPVQVDGTLSSFLRGLRAVEQTLALTIQVTQVVCLKSVSEDTKQKVTGQVRGRSPPKYGMPAASKRPDVEVTQTGDLDAECLLVRYRRTDPYARHRAQDERRLDWREMALLLFVLVIR